jgi:capsular polysaccharide biosynthesis protein
VDEISLVDIAIILYRRKGIALGIFVLCIVAALGAAMLKGTNYDYSTAVKVGTTDNGSPIESPQAVESRLHNAYIPKVLSEIAAARGEAFEDIKYKINVTVPKQGDFVVISGKARESDAEEIRKILNELVAMVVAAHANLTLSKKEQLTQQISDLEGVRASYLSSIGTGANVDSVLLGEMGRELVELKGRLKAFTETSMPFEPTRSIKPVGTGKLLIVTLGAVIGLMIGMFAAFFAEFLARTREQLRDEVH